MKNVLIVFFCSFGLTAFADVASQASNFFETQFNISAERNLIEALFWSELRTSPLNHLLKKVENIPELKDSLDRISVLFNSAFYENNLKKNEQILFLMEKILRQNGVILYISKLDSGYFSDEFNRFLKKLPVRKAVIKFFFLSGRLKVFFIDRSGIQLRDVNIDLNELKKLVERVIDPFEDYNSGQVDLFHIYFDLQAANQLYIYLLKDIIEEKRIDELIVIPDRILFGFPLELLVTSFHRKAKIDPEIIFSEFCSASFLIEKIAISYSFSLFELLRSYSAPKFDFELTAISVNDILLPGKKLLPLRKSYLEAINIEKIFEREKTLLFSGKSATEKNFSEALKKSRYVHLITHLQIDEKTKEPELLFSSGKLQSEGKLYRLYNIGEQTSGKSELLFLSCCQSLQNYFLFNDLFHEISYFFRRNQIRSAIFSFWAVNEFHSELIYQFYLNLRSGYSFSRALQQAKLRMINSEFNYQQIKYSYAHPFLWSNLCLYNFYYPYE